MIACVMLFGPAHGRTFYVEPPLQRELATVESEPPSFQEYRFGEPFGVPRMSMMAKRHIYRLQEVYDQGTEECAVYLHHEDCCEEDYSKSEDYKQNGPIHNPRFKDPMRGKIW